MSAGGPRPRPRSRRRRPHGGLTPRRDEKKGRALLESLDTGTEVHLWLRRSKKDTGFTYCGLVVPMEAEGDAPIHIVWRLLTPAPVELVESS